MDSDLLIYLAILLIAAHSNDGNKLTHYMSISVAVYVSAW